MNVQCWPTLSRGLRNTPTAILQKSKTNTKKLSVNHGWRPMMHVDGILVNEQYVTRYQKRSHTNFNYDWVR